MNIDDGDDKNQEEEEIQKDGLDIIFGEPSIKTEQNVLSLARDSKSEPEKPKFNTSPFQVQENSLSLHLATSSPLVQTHPIIPDRPSSISKKHLNPKTVEYMPAKLPEHKPVAKTPLAATSKPVLPVLTPLNTFQLDGFNQHKIAPQPVQKEQSLGAQVNSHSYHPSVNMAGACNIPMLELPSRKVSLNCSWHSLT